MTGRLTALFSMKGGLGVSSTAALIAIAHSNRAVPTLLADLDGDQPAILGVPEPDGPGLVDWCATPSRSVEALDRIQTSIGPDCALLPRGVGPLPADAGPLLDALSQPDQHVVVDCGNLAGAPQFARDVAAGCDQRLLVVRSCYLALRSSRDPAAAATGVILLREHGRALGLTDIESVIDAPVIAEVAIDIAIARSIDAGLTTTRLPRSLLRLLARVAAPEGSRPQSTKRSR